MVFLIEMKKEFWPLILAAALGACGKGDPAPVAPELPVPDRSFPSADRAAPIGKIPAQAEVTASSGPVQLSLLLHKTKIKLGESLWHQLRIRNVGKQELLVTDQVFRDPWQLKRNAPDRRGIGGYGIYIEVLGPDGAHLDKALYMEGFDNDMVPAVSGMLEIDGPKERAMVNGWKKEGLSDWEVSFRLVNYNMKKRRAAQPTADPPMIKLQPGEIAETKSWFYYSWRDRNRKRPSPQPVGDFAELDFFELDKPGKYKVRAVYNYGMSDSKKAEYRKLGWSYDRHLVVRTPWVEVTVRP